jgi:arylsulfatase A-like enzyme
MNGPNLVFVLADQLRLQSCGYAQERYNGTYAGGPHPHTPNIDRLAAQSVDFRQAVAGSPMCAPYRASLLTGKHSSSTGMVINELRAMPDPDALGHVLGENGYQTGYIGKWHLYGKDHSDEQQFVPPGPHRLGFDQTWKAYNFNHEYYDGFYYEDTFDRIDVDGYEPHTQTDLAIDFLRRVQASEDPFALFLSYGPPHDPWRWDNCPEPFTHLFREKTFPDPPNYEDGHARYWHPEWDEDWWNEAWKPYRLRKRRVYAAQTASLDWEVGRLMHALDRLDLADDTIFVFTSDHGEMFGAQGRIAKKIFYEEAVRVPFLLRWPRACPPHVNQSCLNTPDIAPTLLGLMGLAVPGSMEGADLSKQARGTGGDAAGGGGDTSGKTGPKEAALLQGMGHTFQWHDGDEWRAARDQRYTYAEMLDGSTYLFDHASDPYQLVNLTDDPDHRGARDRLSMWMRKRMEALNDPFRPTTWYNGRWVRDRTIVRSATRELPPGHRPSDDAS